MEMVYLKEANYTNGFGSSFTQKVAHLHKSGIQRCFIGLGPLSSAEKTRGISLNPKP